MDKKMIKIIGIVAGVFVVIILLIFVIAACSKKKFVFDKFQDTMIEAAKKYYENNSKDLPNEDGKTKKVTLKQLINDGYMKEPSETYKDETLVCDGSVTVTNNGGFYLYSPSVTCGKDHRTQYFVDKLLDDSLVETGEGLHQEKINYIITEDDVKSPKLKEVYNFKGESVKNYVKIKGSDKLFRIIRINEDNTIRLIEVKGGDSVVWDDSYNSEKEYNTGINDYVLINAIDSKIKKRIKEYYNDSSVWPDSIKAYITNQGICLGKRAADETNKDGTVECSAGILDQKLGLIAAYEYMNGSLDPNCSKSSSVECSNYNWFTSFPRIWTATGFSADTYKVWYINEVLSYGNASAERRWNVVFNISDKVTYVSGTGTEGDPYIIK